MSWPGDIKDEAGIRRQFYTSSKLMTQVAEISSGTLSRFTRREPLRGCYDNCSHEVHPGFH